MLVQDMIKERWNCEAENEGSCRFLKGILFWLWEKWEAVWGFWSKQWHNLTFKRTTLMTEWENNTRRVWVGAGSLVGRWLQLTRTNDGSLDQSGKGKCVRSGRSIRIYLKVESKSWADRLDAWCERKRGGKDDYQVWDCPSLRKGGDMKRGLGQF